MKYKLFILLNFLILLLFCGNLFSQNIADETIRYSKNISLREISGKYLGNPDLWESILAVNNIGSIENLKEGTLLIIPRSLVLGTRNNLQKTKQLIAEATENGAEIFAKVELDSSLQHLLAAQESITLNNWAAANNKTDTALQYAMEALSKARAMRDKMADATLSQRIGDVEKKRPSKTWKEAELYTELFEKDRARTLDLSSGEISFYDLSRFNLSENSQAIIQKSRIDLLKERNKSTVTLLEGEAFAKLVRNPNENFKVEIPGLSTKVNSKYFWMEKKKGETKIANYDGEIEVGSKESFVTIKSNQGTVIADNTPPSAPENLLRSPDLISPLDASEIFNENITFNWKIIPGAKEYRIRVASDPSGYKILNEYKGITSNTFSVASYSPGIYYWSVASVSKAGLPGKYSNPLLFSIIEDNYSPYLVVTEPADMTATRESSIYVNGKTEKNISVLISGKQVPTSSDDYFSAAIKLTEGVNNITIEAIDNSNNKSVITRKVFCELSPAIILSIDNEIIENSNRVIFTNQRELSLTGRTRPLSNLTFSSSVSTFRSMADSTGEFNVFLTVPNSDVSYSCKVVSPAGYILETSLHIEYDSEPPIIKLENIPERTNSKDLIIAGSVFDAEKIWVNSNEIKIIDSLISTGIILKEGVNKVSIVASDRSGNSVQIERSVFLDTNPPELLSQEFKEIFGKGNNVFNMVLNTKDDSPTKKVAIVHFIIDNKEIVKYVEKESDTGRYNTELDFSAYTSTPLLKKIILSDYLGNNKEYNITN